MKACFINGVASISAQATFNQSCFLEDVIVHNSKTINAIHPNYKDFINPITGRRMATGVKMGIAASKLALDSAQLACPDAIITGTGMGCIEDSEKFLNSIIENDEQYLTPTSFINSTHNTVAAQIALTLDCKGYNVSYVHGSVSFESALYDAQLLLHENEASNVLVGAVDELGNQFIQDIVISEENQSQAILTPFGEGAHFFTISSSRQDGSYCELKAIQIINIATPDSIQENLKEFLNQNRLLLSDVDVIVLGCNGDEFDCYYHNLQRLLFDTIPQIHYKHLCGEFFTASAFGFWVATNILKKQYIPNSVKLNNVEKSRYKNVLLYNQFKGRQHSFTLLTSC